jgi:anthranilate phosphoribosyltransferase
LIVYTYNILIINDLGENLLPKNVLRTAIQKVATGPEFSKNISEEDSYNSMLSILDRNVDSVQAAIYLIAMRMKRETMDENIGSLKALIDKSNIITANVDELLDIAEPYNGFLRNTPMSAFMPAVFSSIGIPCVTHGVETVGPKFGLTIKRILKTSGINVDKTLKEASDSLSNKDIGWTYIDQEKFCKPLYDLLDLRTRMVKRTVLTTIEVLVGPIRAKDKTHLLTGYVHAAYPPVYSDLAKVSGFDSAIMVKGVEGGISPSLRGDAKIFYYLDNNEMKEIKFNAKNISIEQDIRAVPLPKLEKQEEIKLDEISSDINVKDFSEKASEIGKEALSGKDGPAKDTLIYTGALTLSIIRKIDFNDAANQIKKTINSGKAKEFFYNAN